MLGAVLGVINTWYAIDRNRVKLKVIPRQAIHVGNMADKKIRLSINVTNVTNLSALPLTVTEVGVLYHGTDDQSIITNPIIIDGGGFPRKLEPRTSFAAYMYSKVLQRTKDDHSVKCAYTKADCGVLVKGNSPALEKMVRELNVQPSAAANGYHRN